MVNRSTNSRIFSLQWIIYWQLQLQQLFRKHHHNAAVPQQPQWFASEILWRLADCCRRLRVSHLEPQHAQHSWISRWMLQGFVLIHLVDSGIRGLPRQVLAICLLTARGSIPQATSLPITFSAFLQVLCPVGNLQHVPGKRGGWHQPLSSYSSIRHLSPISNRCVIQ